MQVWPQPGCPAAAAGPGAAATAAAAHCCKRLLSVAECQPVDFLCVLAGNAPGQLQHCQVLLLLWGTCCWPPALLAALHASALLQIAPWCLHSIAATYHVLSVTEKWAVTNVVYQQLQHCNTSEFEMALSPVTTDTLDRACTLLHTYLLLSQAVHHLHPQVLYCCSHHHNDIYTLAFIRHTLRPYLA